MVGRAARRLTAPRVNPSRVARPWRVALREERARPCAVVGPWDLAPLMRAVADFFVDTGLVGILPLG